MIRKIGKADIYPEQYRAGIRVWGEFINHRNNVLLLAEPQQGKTGAAIVVIDKFLKFCTTNSVPTENIQILFLTSLSDNSLRAQTEGRLSEAFKNFESWDGWNFETLVQYGHIVIDHIGGSGKKSSLPSKVKEEVSYRLVIFDECHMAINPGGVNHEVLDKVGLKSIVQITEDTLELNPKNTCLLHISATPFPQLVLNATSEGPSLPFSTVIIEKDDLYMGIPEIESSGRLRRYTNLHDVISNYERAFEVGRKAPMVIRTNHVDIGEVQGILAERNYAKAEKPGRKGFMVFDAATGNISEIDKAIKANRKSPYVIIVKNALRAGKTLENYPLVWVETSSKANDDTWIQSIGRMCTRNPEYLDVQVYIPQKAKYNIEETVSFYRKQREGEVSVPYLSSNYNSKGKATQRNHKVAGVYNVPQGIEKGTDVLREIYQENKGDGPIEALFERVASEAKGNAKDVANLLGYRLRKEDDSEIVFKGYSNVAFGRSFAQGNYNALYINPELKDKVTPDVWERLEDLGYVGKVLVFAPQEESIYPELTKKTYLTASE